MSHTITKDGRTIVMPYGFGGWLEMFHARFEDIWANYSTDTDTLDFSQPGQFEVRGWPETLWLPSFVDIATDINQYADWANLHVGQTAMDLGAFAGMTAMTLANAVGPTGRVIALEPDPTNYECAERNLDAFTQRTGLTVELLPLAAWDQTGPLMFMSEHTMGSGAAQYLPAVRGVVREVEAITLTDLAERCQLTRVDYLKMDIEGAEMQVIADGEFFNKYRPRLSVECHDSFGPALAIVTAALDSYGYDYETVKQDFFDLPLLHGWPR